MDGDQRKKSERLRKKRKTFEDTKELKQEYRPCSKSGCGEQMPRCCLQASDNCCRDGYTSRWYHMSLGEHFCNECFDFFYRPHKQGFPKYDSWYHQWYLKSNVRPYIKRYIADEVMPYWLQCTDVNCGKWREVHSLPDPSFEYVAEFNCSAVYGDSQKNPCAVEEESCVSEVSNPHWIKQLSEFPLLQNSPSAPYLEQFCEEGIGLYPINSAPSPGKMPKWIVPFSDGLNGESPMWPQPNEMEKEEQSFMPSFLEFSATYLGLRNLVVAVWNMSPNQWLTAEKVSPHVLCRGLVRIYLLYLVDSIITYLTRKGSINFGIVAGITNAPFLCKDKETVIVIGGGIAGLSAARHLSNLGIKTTVLEACAIAGGRAQHNSSAMAINGLINNPLTVLCHQAEIDICEVSDNLIFIKDDGKIIPPETNERMFHQFSGMMHGAIEWSHMQDVDADWFQTITKHQQDFHNVANFTEEEDEIFNFLLRLTDIEQRTNCKHQTLKKYEFAKKLGSDGLVVQGMPSLIEKLAEGLDIKVNTPVLKVKLCNHHVEVLSEEKCWKASRVIVAVPLPVLRDNHIIFEPPIPKEQTTALHSLGSVLHEQVILKFTKKFWQPVLKRKSSRFAILTSKDSPFQYFVDVTCVSHSQQPTLVTYITDSNISLVKSLDNEGISDLCFNILKSVFKKLRVTVPKPLSCEITRWSQDAHFATCGSFVEVGTSFDLYDQAAANINNRVFFAGESTYRKHPNSLTGAFLSGLREAVNVINSLFPVVPASNKN